jgi:hypothetical protein
MIRSSATALSSKRERLAVGILETAAVSLQVLRERDSADALWESTLVPRWPYGAF